jgi:hypothetical protein
LDQVQCGILQTICLLNSAYFNAKTTKKKEGKISPKLKIGPKANKNNNNKKEPEKD